MNYRDRMASELRRAWSDSAPLTAVSIGMLLALLVALAGLVIDDRTITGVPAWLKPAKFAISTAIYAGTLAWLFRYIDVWPRFVRAMGWITAVAVALEVLIVDIQAARGTTSHFNAETPLDAWVFTVMGAIIALLWLASVGILAALFRQQFRDPAWKWALRMGMLVTVLGSAAGGFMIPPTPEQAQALEADESVPAVGAHTVGAPDGGPGLPGLGWSAEHGDLRIPHFFGLHGVQLIPLLAWIVSLRRRVGPPAVLSIAASYFGFVAILAWQALRGQSIMQPDSATLLAFGAWLMASLGIIGILTGGVAAKRIEASL